VYEHKILSQQDASWSYQHQFYVTISHFGGSSAFDIVREIENRWEILENHQSQNPSLDLKVKQLLVEKKIPEIRRLMTYSDIANVPIIKDISWLMYRRFNHLSHGVISSVDAFLVKNLKFTQLQRLWRKLFFFVRRVKNLVNNLLSYLLDWVFLIVYSKSLMHKCNQCNTVFGMHQNRCPQCGELTFKSKSLRIGGLLLLIYVVLPLLAISDRWWNDGFLILSIILGLIFSVVFFVKFYNSDDAFLRGIALMLGVILFIGIFISLPSRPN